MSFHAAVLSARAPVPAGFRRGNGALTAQHAAKIQCERASSITGSVDLDKVMRGDPGHAQAPRWDYGIGYRPPRGAEVAVWIEVHSAHTGEVNAVLRKLGWLTGFLQRECDGLWRLTRPVKGVAGPFLWLASDGVHIPKHSPQARRLAQSGIAWPRSGLRLP